MFSAVSNSLLNNKINFGRKESSKVASNDVNVDKIEERMNKLFGVSLDQFISVCKERDFYNEHGMSKFDYYNSDEYVDSIASF